MAVKKIVENVYDVGVQHWGRKLFDELIPLPHGTSYSAYVVFGENKIALIDTVDPSKTQILLENLRSLKVKRKDRLHNLKPRRTGPLRIDPGAFESLPHGEGRDERKGERGSSKIFYT